MKKIDKLKQFWKYKLNPITGLKKPKPPKKQDPLNPEIYKSDQASVFKPQGFK